MQLQSSIIHLLNLPVEEVLPLIGAGQLPIKFSTPKGIFIARASGTRLECFRRSLKCNVCGIEGNIFHLERQRHQREQRDDCAYLSLYHDTGKRLILMTKDHLIPISGGGADAIDNLTTCCEVCNNKKGNTNTIWIVLREEGKIAYVKGATKEHALAIYNTQAPKYMWEQAVMKDVRKVRTIN